MNSQPPFIDSNIWLYRLLDNQSLVGSESERKRSIAHALTEAKDVIVSVQVINEVCVNVLKKAAFTEAQIKLLLQSFEDRCDIVMLEMAIVTRASDLRLQYHLSFWDSLIVASALSVNAEVLYSEDMQDGLVVEQRLRIVNPFK
jgi:predicted nucleic acid-binding protein